MSDITLDDYDKSIDDLHNEMLSGVSDKYQKTIGFPVYDILRAVAIVLKKLWDLVYSVLKKQDVTNLTGEELRRFTKQRRNIIWKEGTHASGYLTVKGNFEIKQGDLFQNAAQVQYEATQNVTSIDGSAQVHVQCTKKGVIGNCGAEAIRFMPSTISGVMSVTNEQPFTNGYEDETDESLIERYLEDLCAPLVSGNIYHYKKWAKDVQGVGDARVFPLWNGDNTVKVLIIDANNQAADDELVKKVQDYIDPYTIDNDGNKKEWGWGNGQAPIGAYCTVESAEPLRLSISVDIEKTAVSLDETVKTNCADEIQKYLKNIAFKDDTVSYAQIGSALLRAQSVIDYSELIVNGGKSNIAIAQNQVAVLDNLEITFNA